MQTYDCVIIGAGPAGLAVGIAASEAGLDYVVRAVALGRARRWSVMKEVEQFAARDLLQDVGQHAGFDLAPPAPELPELPEPAKLIEAK